MIQMLENTSIFHYQIKHLLAQGGMSAIYLAHDTITDRDVAIKLVHHTETNYYERFQREAKAVAQLTHDHILPAFDYGEFQSWFYMVMPYIEYGTLRERLINGPLTQHEVGKILTQLADALQCAHTRGIVHRDIKPSNILLRDGEHVYLADFGLVRHVEDRTHLTQTGFLIGTPEYMAPEITEGPATELSDVYALGIVLYQMLTGCVPFNGPTPVAICLKHVREQPLPPSAHNPTLSLAIDNVVLRALAKDPAHRFQRANDLANAFQAAIIGHTSIYSTPTRKMRTTSINVRVGLLAASVALLFLLPALLGVTWIPGHLPTSPILGVDAAFNHGQTLTKPPVAQPTATKTPPPTLHTTATTHAVVKTHTNTGGGTIKNTGGATKNDNGGNKGHKGNGKGKGHGHGGDD